MTVRAVDLHPLAFRELDRAYRWYARRSAWAARRFRPAVDRAVQQIASAAELGPPYRQLYRWVRLHRFPYVLYYEIRDPHPVLIYAVAHAHRRPGYWLRRTRP